MFDQDKHIRLFLVKGNEVYSDQFKLKGVFIIDDVWLTENHPINDKTLVAIIKAHHKDRPTFRVEATSNKFTF